MNLMALLILASLAVSCVSEKSPEAPSSGVASGPDTSTPPSATDPLYEYAWHLKNTGQSSFSLSGGTDGKDLNVEDVHLVLGIKGAGVKIAVSDDAIDFRHPDLLGNSLTTQHRDYSRSLASEWLGSDPSPTDATEAHGTSVTGLIAALGWNNIGSRGVAPGAKFAGFRYLYPYNPAESDVSKLSKEIDQTDGDFDIFNYSYGPTDFYFAPEDEVVFDAYESGATFLRLGYGATYVQSSGNGFTTSYEACTDINDPSTCFEVPVAGNTNAHETTATPYKVIVGALNADGTLTSYSTPGSGVWITAPAGEDGFAEPAMVTTDLRGCLNGYSYKPNVVTNYFNYGYHPLNLRCDYANTFNGTSAAAPVTTGVIALLLEANPELTWRDVKHILAMTADQPEYDYLLPTIVSHPNGLDMPGYTYDELWVENKAFIPFSNYYGFGSINAGAAVNMARSYQPGSLGTYDQTIGPSSLWYYDSGAISELIPENDPDGAQNQIWVAHNLVIESVEIQISSDHDWPGELAVHLTSPMGTESRLLQLNSNIYTQDNFANTRMITNAFYNEQSFGYWTIKVVDGNGYDTGNLTNWKIKINGHKKTSEILKPHPPTHIVMPSFVSVNSDLSPEFSFDPSTSSVTGYEVAIGFSEIDEDVKNWTAVTVTNGIVISGLNFPLIDGGEYFLKVRARNGTRTSNPQLFKWTANL